jgi:hypothetical protein
LTPPFREGVTVRRPLLLVPLAVVLSLTAPAVAAAGGFATAGLSSTPDGVDPGQPWTVDITVLQHGRTPLAGITPRVRISSSDSQRFFGAKPTGAPGVYRATVVFPTAGRWDYQVLDGFNDSMPHTFPAVDIGGGAAAAAAAAPADSPRAPAPAPDEGGIASGWLWGAGAAVVLALAVLAADRLRRRTDVARREPKPA